MTERDRHRPATTPCAEATEVLRNGVAGPLLLGEYGAAHERDGNDTNCSWNCAAEAPTDGPEVNTSRARQKRNLIATLVLSQGVHMLLAGDEMGRTHQGNSNAYCQANEISWVDWDISAHGRSLLRFAQRLVHFRKQHPVFRRQHFFQGRPIRGADIKDIVWLNPLGEEMNDDEWNQSFARCLGVYLFGAMLDERDRRNQPIADQNFLLLFNAADCDIPFVLPGYQPGTRWAVSFDTARVGGEPSDRLYVPCDPYPLESRSLSLLVQTQPERGPRHD